LRPCLLAAAASLLALGSCGRGDRGKTGAREPGAGVGPARPASIRPAAPPAQAGRVSWGPVAISSTDRRADGISTALGVGQAAAVWIEDASPGADVRFVSLGEEGAGEAVDVTAGASAFPPTAVEWSGREFALAWGDDRFRHIEVFVARVAWNGKTVMSPRRFTRTIVSGKDEAGVPAADSSQEPALAYYAGQLIMAWGGPGEGGRQQVYFTTISPSGTPGFDPLPLTSGPADAFGIRLESFEKGALISYCVMGSGSSDIYGLALAGSPPEPVQPLRLAASAYIPCSVDQVVGEGGSVALWVERREDPGGGIEDRLSGQALAASGEFEGGGFEIPGARIVKFPGKHHVPFDAIDIGGGRMAVAWIERGTDGGSSLRVGVFERAAPIGASFTVPSQADPTDPHLVPSGGAGGAGGHVIVWLDRPLGSAISRVFAAGLEFD